MVRTVAEAGWRPSLWSGFGQLLFIEDARVGVLVFVAIALNSPYAAFCGFLGAFFSMLAAQRSGEPDMHRKGLLGFNGILLGLAAALFLEPAWPVWIVIALGGALTAKVFAIGAARGWPVLTVPYITIMIIAYLTLDVRPIPDIGYGLHWPEYPLVSGLLTGVSQMAFQPNVLSAALIVIALITGGGVRMLSWALAGSFAGAAIATLGAASMDFVATGIYSYNAALAAVALGCLPGHSHLAWQPWCGILLASLLTLVGIALLPVPVLTAPFVLAMWSVMLLQTGQSYWRLRRD